MEFQEIITSRQNPLIKMVCGLTEKKKRKEQALFRLDGYKLLEEAVSCRMPLAWILIREKASDSFFNLAFRALETGLLPTGCVITVSDSVFEKLSEEKSPEGILTVAKMTDCLHPTLCASELPSKIAQGERLLLAEALRDPGNLGTVIRSCDALGIDRLILSDDCADLYHSRTIRAAMGALFRLPTVTVSGSFADAVCQLRASGRQVYATALHRDAWEIGKTCLSSGACFVIGNEGHGLSAEVIDACDGCAVIPMRQGSESLNAAAAAAICIWETVRAKS